MRIYFIYFIYFFLIVDFYLLGGLLYLELILILVGKVIKKGDLDFFYF